MSFHVTELSRITSGPLATDSAYGNNGAFDIESAEPGWRLAIIASDEKDAAEINLPPWQHVSVRAYNRGGRSRIPSWKEMCQVKDLFWDAEDVVMQLHPARSEYVNCHSDVLHLWKPVGQEIPTPPSEMVGPK